ncbi:MAG: hypothetical protein ABSH32_32830 [Bryobacteraceae bacterium]|jgi:hypothetical protein
MTKDDEIQRFKKRILELEGENDELKRENEALKKTINFARGAPAEELIAKLTDGERTGYKDRHDVTTKSGHRLEVKLSHLNNPSSSRTRRWNWEGLLGRNETKEYDFLVLVGQKDRRYGAQYPDFDLDYVIFLVPRGDVDSIKSRGNRVALNTNLATARAQKSIVLKSYLVSSPECFMEFRRPRSEK